MSEPGRELGQADPWRTRRVMRLYAAGETIPLISRSVGWSEGRVSKVLREAGVVLHRRGGSAGTQELRGGQEEAARSRLGGEDAGRASRLAAAGRARKLVCTRGGGRDFGGSERGASGGA